MKIRAILAVALVAGVALGTAGCNLIQPQATTKQYDASDGVGVNLGDLDLRNMMILTDNKGTTASLMMAAVNTTNDAITLHMSYVVNGERVTVRPIVIEPTEQPAGFGGEGQPQIVLEQIDVAAGGILALTLQAGESDTTVVPIPVLNTDLPEYRGLQPTPVPLITMTATPSPSATPAP